MGVKKTASKRPMSASYDTSRFVSKAASERYEASLTKHEIKERGFSLRRGSIAKQIRNRHWEKFVQQPGAAVMTVVREFYANAPEHEDGEVFVRGEYVSIDRTAINKFFGLEDIPTDGYSLLQSQGLDYVELMESLCPSGGQWKMSKGEFVSFPSNLMRRQSRAWYYFLAGRLMPTSHMSNVTKNRALLLYALVFEKSIDIGDVIHLQIMQCAITTTAGLFFPSLVTEMCKAAGVHWDSSEEHAAPRRVIDESTYRKINDLPGFPPSDDEEDAAPPRRSTSSTAANTGISSEQYQELLRRMEAKERRDERFQQHVTQCFDVVERMYFQWAAKQFPRFQEHQLMRMPKFSADGASTSNQPAPDQPMEDADDDDEDTDDDDEVEIIEEDDDVTHVQTRRSARFRGRR